MPREVFRTDAEYGCFQRAVLTLRKIRGAAVSNLSDDHDKPEVDQEIVLNDGLELAQQTGQLIINRVFYGTNRTEFNRWAGLVNDLYEKYRTNPDIKYSALTTVQKHCSAVASLNALATNPDSDIHKTVFNRNDLHINKTEDLANPDKVIVAPLSTDAIHAAWVQAYIQQMHGQVFTLKVAALTKDLLKGALPDLTKHPNSPIRIMLDGISTGQTSRALYGLLKVKYPYREVLEPFMK